MEDIISTEGAHMCTVHIVQCTVQSALYSVSVDQS